MSELIPVALLIVGAAVAFLASEEVRELERRGEVLDESAE